MENLEPNIAKPNETLNSFEGILESTINSVLERYPRLKELGESFTSDIEILKKKVLDVKKGNNIEKGKVIEVKYSKKLQSPYIIGDRGVEDKITIGQVVAGMEWGSEFYLSFDSFKEAGKTDLYYKYITKYIEKETIHTLNKHIVVNETKVKNPERERAYAGVLKGREVSIDDMSYGVKAERLVEAYLSRISLDNPDLQFELIRTNAYEDVSLTVDFIVKIHKAEKGVKVESLDTIKKIQFTTNKSPIELAVKKDRAQRFGVILVEMPEIEIGEVFKTWKRNINNKTKWPDSYLPEETQAEIKKAILG